MPEKLVSLSGALVRSVAAVVAVSLGAVATATPAIAASSPLPRLRISPTAGPPSTVITLTGHLTPSQRRDEGRADGVTAYIAQGQPHAGLEVYLRGDLRIAHDGAMRLVVRLPVRADWAPNPMTHSTDRLSQTPAPAVLELAWPCRACGVGTFDVTAPATVLPFTGGQGRELLVLAVVLLVAGCGAVAAVGRRRS